MEIPVVSGPGGIRRTTAITSGATVAFDLTNFANYYVEFYADQDIVWGFAPSASTTFTTSGEVNASAAPESPKSAAFTIGRPAALGIWTHRLVSPATPFLLVRANSASTALFILTPASDKQFVY
jgi:hypothetical protein